jgi:hypothetical protein
MTNDKTTAEAKDSRSYWGFLLWPCLIILAYVLSTGPVGLLWDKGIIRGKRLVVYAPLEFVVRHIPSLQRPLNMYLQVWDDNIYIIGGDITKTRAGSENRSLIGFRR